MGIRAGSANRGLGGLSTGNLADNVALAAAAEEVLGIVPPDNRAVLDQLVAIARSAGPWLMGKDRAVLSERPLRLRLDDRGRLHSIDGPALAYSDGTEAFAIHGVVVPRTWSRTRAPSRGPDRRGGERRDPTRPRRALRGGAAHPRGRRHAGPRGRDRPTLAARAAGTIGWSGRDEPIVMVEVVNSTPEPDGTRRTYFLRVPPDTRTAREAVAWTFGLGGGEYRPAAES